MHYSMMDVQHLGHYSDLRMVLFMTTSAANEITAMDCSHVMYT